MTTATPPPPDRDAEDVAIAEEMLPAGVDVLPHWDTTPPDGSAATPAIRTAADLALWLDGFDAGTATILRTLTDVPADKLPAVIAAMVAATSPTDAKYRAVRAVAGADR